MNRPAFENPVDQLASRIGIALRRRTDGLPMAHDDDNTPSPAMPSRPGRDGYLIVLEGPRTGDMYRMDAPELLIGRAGEARIHMPETAVSRAHARFTEVDGRLFIEDLGSTNGTFCNDVRVTDCPVEVHDGDIIKFGTISAMKFSAAADEHELFRARLLELGARDAVTGTLRVDYMLERLAAEFQLSYRHGVPMALLVVDVDFMGHINRTVGQNAGDRVLRHVAKIGRAKTRREDFFGRWKDDKFVAVCRGTTLHGAAQLAERIRRAVNARPVSLPTATFPVAVSIGIAVAPGPGLWTADDLLAAGELAVTDAKNSGRNCVHPAVGFLR
jgi:two-component system, cell cycle response regulator